MIAKSLIPGPGHPTFHYIGVGWWIKSDEFYRLTGWTYWKFGYGVKKDETLTRDSGLSSMP